MSHSFSTKWDSLPHSSTKERRRGTGCSATREFKWVLVNANFLAENSLQRRMRWALRSGFWGFWVVRKWKKDKQE